MSFTKRFHDYTPRYRIPHAYRMRSGAGYICFFRDHSLSSAFSIGAYRSFFKRAFRNVRPFARREGKNLERVTNDARQKRCLQEIHALRYAVARICEIGLIFFRRIIDNRRVYAFRSRPWAKHASTIRDVTTSTTELSNAPCFPLLRHQWLSLLNRLFHLLPFDNRNLIDRKNRFVARD